MGLEIFSRFSRCLGELDEIWTDIAATAGDPRFRDDAKLCDNLSPIHPGRNADRASAPHFAKLATIQTVEYGGTGLIRPGLIMADVVKWTILFMNMLSLLPSGTPQGGTRKSELILERCLSEMLSPARL